MAQYVFLVTSEQLETW